MNTISINTGFRKPKSFTQSLLINSLILMAALTMLSCGSSKDSSYDMSSRLSASQVSAGGKPMAYCNQGASGYMTGNTKATVPNGVWNPQYIIYKLSNVPTSFTNDQNYIQFFRWMSSSDGTNFIDKTALKYRVIDLATTNTLSVSGHDEITDWKSSLGWSSLSKVSSSLGITDTQTMFKRIALLIDLRDTKGEYDVIRTAYYQTSTNSLVTNGAFDMLLPIFYANPADYATDTNGSARSPSLTKIHPLVGSSLSTSEYQARMDTYCDVFNESH